MVESLQKVGGGDCTVCTSESQVSIDYLVDVPCAFFNDDRTAGIVSEKDGGVTEHAVMALRHRAWKREFPGPSGPARGPRLREGRREARFQCFGSCRPAG